MEPTSFHRGQTLNRAFPKGESPRNGPNRPEFLVDLHQNKTLFWRCVCDGSTRPHVRNDARLSAPKLRTTRTLTESAFRIQVSQTPNLNFFSFSAGPQGQSLMAPSARIPTRRVELNAQGRRVGPHVLKCAPRSWRATQKLRDRVRLAGLPRGRPPTARRQRRPMTRQGDRNAACAAFTRQGVKGWSLAQASSASAAFGDLREWYGRSDIIASNASAIARALPSNPDDDG